MGHDLSRRPDFVPEKTRARPVPNNASFAGAVAPTRVFYETPEGLRRLVFYCVLNLPSAQTALRIADRLKVADAGF
jgi:hypothetical protein